MANSTIPLTIIIYIIAFGKFVKKCANEIEKQKAKIISRVNDIREESGYSIDNTWTIFPTGVVEIRDNSLVPLQLGKTKISKLIDGELKSLRVEVVEDDEEPYNPDDSEEYNDDSSYDNKPIDKSTNNIVNPKTLNAIVIIIAFTVSVIGSTIYLMQRKSMN